MYYFTGFGLGYTIVFVPNAKIEVVSAWFMGIWLIVIVLIPTHRLNEEMNYYIFEECC